MTNPLKRDISVSLEWHSDVLRLLDEPTQMISIGPRQTRRVTQRVVLPRTQSTPALGVNLDCVLETEFKGTPWKGKTHLPITVAGILMHAELPRKPHIQLRDISHVVNLSEHDPHTVHLLWNGPKDLSLSGKLARTEDGILLEAVVEDDVLFSPERVSLDKADCLQIAIRQPNSPKPHFITVGGTQQKPRIQTIGTDGGKDPELEARIRIDGTQRIYRLNLSDTSFGWDANLLREKGIPFNICARDNDGRGLKGWIQLAPGFSKSPSASTDWVRAVFR